MTAASLAKEPYFKRQDALAILEILEGRKCIVGHNVVFDYQRLRDTFMLAEAKDLVGRLDKLQFRCTMALAKKQGLTDGLISLDALSRKVLGIQRHGLHDSLKDAIMAAKVWLAL